MPPTNFYLSEKKMMFFHLIRNFPIVLLTFSCGQTAPENPAGSAQPVVLNESEIQKKEGNQPPVPAESTTFTLDYVMGKFEPENHPDFLKIDKKYADDDKKWMRKDAFEAFLKMREAALKAGIDLKILSAARNFDRQKSIWEAKWTGSRLVENQDLSKTITDPEKRALKILEYSSMPGTSRHHWGTDIDLNSLEPEFFQKGEGKKIYDWLKQNAPSFGYGQPYSPKGNDRPFGYNEEQWHWSYLPVAKQLTDLAEKSLNNEMIKGFLGAESAPKIDVVRKFVLGINPACR